MYFWLQSKDIFILNKTTRSHKTFCSSWIVPATGICNCWINMFALRFYNFCIGTTYSATFPANTQWKQKKIQIKRSPAGGSRHEIYKAMRAR